MTASGSYLAKPVDRKQYKLEKRWKKRFVLDGSTGRCKVLRNGAYGRFWQKENRGCQKNGQWHALKPAAVTEEQIACVTALLEGHEPACTNFQAMSLSEKKTYTRAYFDTKTDAGREKRIAWMVDRLNKNL